MGKRRRPILEYQLARDIWHELVLYAKDEQFIPTQHALYTLMAQPQWDMRRRCLIPARYPELKRGTYDYYFRRLVEEGYIQVDFKTRSIRSINLVITTQEESD